MSSREALESLTYVHNQTGNIYTHLLGFLAFLLIVPLDVARRPELFQTTGDVVWCVAFYVGTSAMLALSALYHVFECASPSVERTLYSCDILGIAISVSCICFVNVWFGFRCNLVLRSLFFLLCGGCGSSLAVIAITRAHEWTVLLRGFYAITAACFTLGITMGAVRSVLTARGEWQGDQPMYGVVGSLALITLGSYFYNYRVPEAWYPGRFDMWGHSHQLWHACVFLAPVSTYIGVITCPRNACPPF